jgi:hypothetical protein
VDDYCVARRGLIPPLPWTTTVDDFLTGVLRARGHDYPGRQIRHERRSVQAALRKRLKILFDEPRMTCPVRSYRLKMNVFYGPSVTGVGDMQAFIRPHDD